MTRFLFAWTFSSTMSTSNAAFSAFFSIFGSPSAPANETSGFLEAEDESTGVGVIAEAASAMVAMVPLQKQYVPVVQDNKTVAYKTSYFGSLRIGSPTAQPFTAVFDTGSGHLILPSSTCESETCAKHNRYERSLSDKAVDIEYTGQPLPPDAVERDQVSISFGTGQVVGEFVQDDVCIGPDDISACVSLRTVLAVDMTENPFGLFQFDGVLGLGLSSLALTPEFSFLAQLSKQNPTMKPRFAFFLSRHDTGKSFISFGGHDESHAATDFEWTETVKQDLGYWQVQIKSVRVGDTLLDDCSDGTCHAILDTGSSMVGVPRGSLRQLQRLLARPVPADASTAAAMGGPPVDCRQIPGAELKLELSSGTIVTLGPEDIARPAPINITLPNTEKTQQAFCRSLLLPLDMPAPVGPKVFIFGEPLLRRYYTIYDVAEQQVGFALARHEVEPEGALFAVDAPSTNSLVSGAPLRI